LVDEVVPGVLDYLSYHRLFSCIYYFIISDLVAILSCWNYGTRYQLYTDYLYKLVNSVEVG